MLYLRENNLWVQDEGQPPRLLKNSGSIRLFRRFPGSERVFYIQVDRYGREELWLTSVDGAALRKAGPNLLKGSITSLGPLSPDGRMLAFTLALDELNREIWVASTVGGGAWRVVSSEALRARLDPGLPPDTGVSPWLSQWLPGREPILLYEINPMLNERTDFTPQVHAVQVMTGQDQITPFSGPPIFSPDGRTAALPTETGLLFSGPDGSPPVRAGVDYHAVGQGGFSMHPQMAWLPDSSAVLLAQFRREETSIDPNATTDLWRVPADGSAAGHITTVEAVLGYGSFSPGRSLFQYTRATEPILANVWELRIARLPADPGGAVAETLYDRQVLASFAGWSPGERYFLYTAGIFGGGSLMLGDLCGKPFRLDWNRYSLQGWIDEERFVLYASDESAGTIQYFMGGVEGQIASLLQLPLAYGNVDIWVP